MFAQYGHVRLYTHVYFNNVHNTVAMPLVSSILLTITCHFFCDLFFEKRQISSSYHMGRGENKGGGGGVFILISKHISMSFCAQRVIMHRVT